MYKIFHNRIHCGVFSISQSRISDIEEVFLVAISERCIQIEEDWRVSCIDPYSTVIKDFMCMLIGHKLGEKLVEAVRQVRRSSDLYFGELIDTNFVYCSIST